MIEATLLKGANDLNHYNLHGYPPERFSVYAETTDNAPSFLRWVVR